MNLKDACCRDCAYAAALTDNLKRFLCRRHAPRTRFFDAEDLGQEAVWPLVYGDDWCGEFVVESKKEEG